MLDNSHDIYYPESLKEVLKKFFIDSDFTFQFANNGERIEAWVIGSEHDNYKPTEWVTLYLDALSTPKSKAHDECKPYIHDNDYDKIQNAVKKALEEYL